MGRKYIPADDPAAHKLPLTCMFTTSDMEIIRRVAHHYGISRAAAVRMMMRTGSALFDPDQKPDPSPPTEEDRS